MFDCLAVASATKVHPISKANPLVCNNSQGSLLEPLALNGKLQEILFLKLGEGAPITSLDREQPFADLYLVLYLAVSAREHLESVRSPRNNGSGP